MRMAMVMMNDDGDEGDNDGDDSKMTEESFTKYLPY